MKRRWFVLVSLIGFLFLWSCEHGIVKNEVTPVADVFTVTYELPTIPDFEVVNLANSIDGINFYSSHKTGVSYGMYAYDTDVDYEPIDYESFSFFKRIVDRGYDTENASKISYTISITTETDNGKSIIILRPIKKQVQQYAYYNTSIPIPSLTLSQLQEYLSEGFIIVNGKIEIDSPYNVESTYANFKRLLKSEDYGKKDSVSGKIFKDVFYVDLKSTTSPVQVFLEAYPYRNGSKAVVYLSNAKLYAMNDNGVYNFDEIIKELKDKITKVVND